MIALLPSGSVGRAGSIGRAPVVYTIAGAFMVWFGAVAAMVAAG